MSVDIRADAGVMTITLNRPEALNAMDTATYRDLTAVLREVDRNPEIRAAIITGTGDRAFSAGADLKEMHQQAGSGSDWRPWRADRWDLGVEVSKPLIAAIDGYALAGGLELALLCDVRIATARSMFGTPEPKWNLLHGFGALRLPAVVGLGNAMMMLLTGEFIDGAEAHRIGLVNRLVEPEELLAESARVAVLIAANASTAVAMTKELALRGLDTPLEQYMRLYGSYMDRLEGSDEQLRRTGEFSGSDGSRG
jgi:enoyl-CoA hydratase/carnithine racemase